MNNPDELKEYLEALRKFESEKRAENQTKLQADSKKLAKRQKTADNRSAASLTAGQLGAKSEFIVLRTSQIQCPLRKFGFGHTKTYVCNIVTEKFALPYMTYYITLQLHSLHYHYLMSVHCISCKVLILHHYILMLNTVIYPK